MTTEGARWRVQVDRQLSRGHALCRVRSGVFDVGRRSGGRRASVGRPREQVGGAVAACPRQTITVIP